MGFGRVIHALHDFGGQDGVVDVGANLFAGAHALDEFIDFAVPAILVVHFGHIFDEVAVFFDEEGAVGVEAQAAAALGAHEVNELFALVHVLSPGAVDGDDGAGGADHAHAGVVYVVGAVDVLGVFRPHVAVGVLGNVLAQLAEGFAGHGQGLGIAHAVHDQVDVVHAPVDQAAAAGDGLGGEGTADAGDGAMGAEGSVHMVYFAQTAFLDVLLDHVDVAFEAVYNADVENLAGFVADLLHFAGFGVVDGGGLFAQHVLAGAHGVDGDLGVHEVRGADVNGFHFGIGQNILVIHNGSAAAVVGNSLFSALGDDVAEILDFNVVVYQVAGDVMAVGDHTAADDSNLNLVVHN